MIRLVQLQPGGDWVAADQVKGVQSVQNGVLVHMNDGTQHAVRCSTIGEIGPMRDALAQRINDALSPAPRINPDGYATAETARWFYPAAGEMAPKGAIVQLLTEGGKQVQGIWRDSGSYIAWAPNLKRDRELEKQYNISNNEGI